MTTIHPHRAATWSRIMSESLPAERVRRGGYVLLPRADDALSRHLELIEATRIQGFTVGAVVSHASAGILHGLPVPAAALREVWITGDRRGGGHAREKLHRVGAPIDPDEWIELDGLPITTLPRTVVDMARTYSLWDGVAAADAALRSVDRGTLQAALERHPRRPGNKRARRVLAFADGLSESWGESASRVIMADQNVPAPLLQQEFFERGRLIARADFWWPRFGLVGEYDGEDKYSGAFGRSPQEAYEREKQRDAWLHDRDIRVVRWGRRDLGTPTALGHRLLRAMARPAGTGPWPTIY